MLHLAKIVIVVLALGAILQPDGLRQAIRTLEDAFGPAVVAPGGRLIGLSAAMAEGGIRTFRSLPEPWHGLCLTIGGLVAVVMILSIIRAAAPAALRLASWVRDCLV